MPEGTAMIANRCRLALPDAVKLALVSAALFSRHALRAAINSGSFIAPGYTSNEKRLAISSAGLKYAFCSNSGMPSRLLRGVPLCFGFFTSTRPGRP